MSRLRRRRGFTLIELIVSMGLFAILGGIVTSVIARTLINNRKVEAVSLVQRDVNLATDRLNRIFRSTTQLIQADSVSIRLRGYPNAADVAPSEIYLYIDSTGGGSALRYQVIPPSGAAPTYTYNQANAVTYTLLSKITNSVSLPLFKYYDESGAQLSVPVSLGDIRIIESLPSAVDPRGLVSPPVAVATRSTLRNFKTNL